MRILFGGRNNRPKRRAGDKVTMAMLRAKTKRKLVRKNNATI